MKKTFLTIVWVTYVPAVAFLGYFVVWGDATTLSRIAIWGFATYGAFVSAKDIYKTTKEM